MAIIANKSHKQDLWSGKLGFILSLTGAAVGLGNIWRFPYLLNEGGGVFLLLYALCMFILVLPIMFFEIRMGQIIRKSPISAFRDMSIKYKTPRFFIANAYLGLLIVLCVLTFYTIVSGWVVYYLLNSIASTPAISFEASYKHWGGLLANPYKMVFFNIIFLISNFLVMIQGIKNGLELLNKAMLPGLLIILAFMLVFAGFSEDMDVNDAVDLLFSFESSKLNSKVFMSALGQALFTLAVGACAILAYGAYLPKTEGKILLSANIIIITQLVISAILGIIIYSLLLGGSIEGASDYAGPELIFVALPVFFAKTAFPKLLTFLFFVITLFAAITSSVNIAEPMVYTLQDRLKLSRKKACAYVMLCIAVTSSLLTFSFILEYDFFGKLIDLVTEFVMPVAAFIFSILAGWFVDKTLLKAAVFDTEKGKVKRANMLEKIFYLFSKYSMRFLFPAALILVNVV